MPSTVTRASLVAIAVLLFAHPALTAESIGVFVSIVPQKYFVEQIAGDRVDVQVMVTPGASPATFEPRPRQMAALAKARAYFAIGVPFEKVWLKKISAANRKMMLVHTDQGIPKRPMATHHHHDDAHAHGTQHGDQGKDPHIWLSPPLVKLQADTILTALQAIDPPRKQEYAANHRRFMAAIDILDAELRSAFVGHQHLRFMAFHPSWGYFADTYGLTQVPIEIEGKHPKPAQLRALIEDARERDIRVVFVQPQFSTKSAQLIAREIGGRVAVADPLADDWMANLRAVAAEFKAALK